MLIPYMPHLTRSRGQIGNINSLGCLLYACNDKTAYNRFYAVKIRLSMCKLNRLDSRPAYTTNLI